MPSANRPRPRASDSASPEVVDPRWILKAIGAVFALGLLCAYLTLCIFFYATQWQYVLHPSRTVSATPASQHLAFETVRFGDNIAGQPELQGWWLPSDSPSDPTALVLHGENGSMSDILPAAHALHDARLNVLTFDYRGYGQSAGRHPTEQSMEKDARQAFQYLTDTRKLPESHIVVFGNQLGASLATTLCSQQPAVAGLILLDADGDTASRVKADQRSRIVPLSLLFHERFPLADALHTLRTPKLLISYTKGEAPEVAQRAADPKVTTELAPTSGPQAITAAVRRFLDTYVDHPAASLEPTAH